MNEDEKVVCFRALKTFYNDLEKIFMKKSDVAPPSLDYDNLMNKPSINGVELIGNRTCNDLEIQPKIAEVLPDGVAIEAPVIAPEIVAKEVKAQNLYENAQIDKMLTQKVNVYQGEENVGKSMIVESDGNLIPKSVNAGVSSITDDEIDELMRG